MHPYLIPIEKGRLRLRGIFFIPHDKSVRTVGLRSTAVDSHIDLKSTPDGDWVPRKEPLVRAEKSAKWRHPNVLTGIQFPLRGTEKFLFEQEVFNYAANNDSDSYFVDYQVKVQEDGIAVSPKGVPRPGSLEEALVLDLSMQSVHCGKDILTLWGQIMCEVFGEDKARPILDDAWRYGITGAINKLQNDYQFLLHRLFLAYPNIAVIKYLSTPYFSDGVKMKTTAFIYDPKVIESTHVVNTPDISVGLD